MKDKKQELIRDIIEKLNKRIDMFLLLRKNFNSCLFNLTIVINFDYTLDHTVTIKAKSKRYKFPKDIDHITFGNYLEQEFTITQLERLKYIVKYYDTRQYV